MLWVEKNVSARKDLKKNIQNFIGIVTTYGMKIKISSFSPAVTVLQGSMTYLEYILCLLECLIFASEIWCSIMSTNLTGICLKHFHLMKIKDVHEEMVTM